MKYYRITGKINKTKIVYATGDTKKEAFLNAIQKSNIDVICDYEEITEEEWKQGIDLDDVIGKKRK